MSASAKRVSGSVLVDRFEWQGPVAPSPAPPMDAQPYFTRFERAGAQGLREFSLPGLTAERAAAAEREAFAKGYADGERVAEQAAAARIEALLGRLTATIQEVGALRSGMIRRTERELVRLAIAMAERIVRREVTVDPAVIASIARAAVERLGERVAATIHLNPADFEAAGGADAASTPGAIELVADPHVPRGGAKVRSSFGVIDAGIDTQVRELARVLLGEPDPDDEGGDGRTPVA